jgi:S-adenosylmethionine:tRNA ribosyltransferase-isomerase
MLASELDFDLPPELIAQTPIEPRDAARMLVLRRDGGALEHRFVRELPELLRAGDLLVFNDTAFCARDYSDANRPAGASKRCC